MATSASQTYVARLGFSDPDRSKDRHGLACEYLYERLLEIEKIEPAHNDEYSSIPQTHLSPSNCINFPIKKGYSIVGFADVLIFGHKRWFLGEVKITRQPAEQVLQQINFYRAQLGGEPTAIYILVDYECSDLQRLTRDSRIKVYRLGQRFEDWLTNRHKPESPEL